MVGVQTYDNDPLDNPESFEEEQKHAMTSTWWKDPAQRSFTKHPLAWLGYSVMYHGTPPVRTDKVPIQGVLEQHMWIMPRAIPPVIAQYISMKYFNFSWPAPLAYGIYSIWLLLMITSYLDKINMMTDRYGFLDAGAPRDYIPDAKRDSTMIFLLLTLVLRVALACFAAYDQHELPSFDPWWPVNAFIFVATLDFYFYWYHRAMHEVPWLWKFHRTHHTTKHPSPLLSAFADPQQDICDIVVIPLLTWLTYPVDFHTWWLLQNYILWIEATGHSGIRMQIRLPLTYPVLDVLGMDLALEDHDLHHRNGWRKSSNYGKQTRIWDVLFGSTRERIELKPENCVKSWW